jgi:hypothetical protein
MALGFRVRGEKYVIPALRDTQTLPGSMSAMAIYRQLTSHQQNSCAKVVLSNDCSR